MSAKTEFKTSKDDFKLFKRTFLEWCVKFGLNDWEVSFRWEEPDGHEACGGIARNTPGRNATVYLYRTWTMPVTRTDVVRTAIHEFSHLLIADMEHLAGQRFVTESEIDICRESLARRFENAFAPVKHG